MEPFNLWNESAWYLELIYNVLLFVLPTLAGAAVSTVFGAGVVRAFKWLWRTFRPLVDEPTDPLVVRIARESGKSPEFVSTFLTSNLDRVVALLPGEAIK